MAGPSVIAALLLICSTLVFCSQNNIKVVNLPPEIDYAENFLEFLPETDATSEYVGKKREPTESATSETTSLVDVNNPEISQNLLNAEREYSRNLQEDISGEHPIPSSVETDNEVTDDETSFNEIEDVQVTDIPLDFSMLGNFIDSEKHHTYGRPESINFRIQSPDEEGSPNVNVCGTVNLDKIVDKMLDSLRYDIVQHGYDKIKIPDIHETFIRKAGIFEVKGYFDATEGWAKNLSTVYRTDHVIASSHGNSLSVSCGFGLKDLQFGYDKYKAKFMNIGPNGKLNVSISKNSILLNATVSWNNGTCKTTLDYLSLNKLGGFKLKINGLGPLNWILTKLSDWLFKKFHEEIREKVESTLRDEIEEQLKDFDCAKHLLGWHGNN